MKNKVLISILCCFAFVVLIVVLSSTVFTLKEVKVEFYDTNDQLITDYNTLKHFSTTDSQSIIDSAEFNMGQNIFLVKKEKYTESLEKKNPYIKVIALTTHFPNKIVIKVHEREELFAIETGSGKYAITDGDMKVLKIADDFEELDAVKINNLEMDAASVGEGIKLTGGNISVAAKLHAGLQKSLDIVLALKNQVILQLFKSVTFETDTLNNEQTMITMMTRDDIPLYDADGNKVEDPDNPGQFKKISISGMKIEIHNVQKLLEDKIAGAFQIFEYIVNQEYDEIEVEGGGAVEEYKGTIKIFDAPLGGLKKVYVPAV